MEAYDESSASNDCKKYIGVRQRPSGRWAAEVKDSKTKLKRWLGTFDTPEDAARAYDEAVRILRGPKARTNFDPADPYAPFEDMAPFSFDDPAADQGLVGALKEILARKAVPGENIFGCSESDE